MRVGVITALAICYRWKLVSAGSMMEGLSEMWDCGLQVELVTIGTWANESRRNSDEFRQRARGFAVSR